MFVHMKPLSNVNAICITFFCLKVITFFYLMIHLDLPTHQTIPHFGNLKCWDY